MGQSIHFPPPEEITKMSALRKHVTTFAEDRPGVYRMVGPEDEILYVGKSVRVRSRLLSYFRLEPGHKKADLIRATNRIEWDHVPNEFRALLREMRLIRRHRPRYNVEHNRKRRYGFIKVTREPAPRLVLTGRVADDGATYYGPFPAPAKVQDWLRDLVHLLQIRDCPGSTPIHFGDQLELLSSSPREPLCMRAELGTCPAPCAGRCTSEEYMENVETARRFLEGRTREPLRRLRGRMERAAESLEFEYAALLRDRVDRLEGLRDQLVGFRGRVRGLSFVYRVPGFKGNDRLYLIRRGRVLADLPHPKGREERAAVARRIEEVFGGAGCGARGLDADQAAEILLVARWFRLRPKELERTMAPEEWLEEKKPAA